MMRFLFRRFRRRRYRRVATPRKLKQGDTILHRGERLTLRISEDRNRLQGCETCAGFLDVNLPDANAGSAERGEEVRLEVALWQKREARLVFRERTDFWAEQLKVKYRRLTPSNPRRQWGSCSARDDIRINWRLIMTAPELLDYVVVHELCHVTHKNHSWRFWNMVATVMPDWKARRMQLRQLDPAANP